MMMNEFETLPIDSANYIETRGRDRHGIDKKPCCIINLLWCS